MKCRWVGRNVKILDVEESVKSFLQEQGFKTVSLDSKDSKKVVGTLQTSEGRKKVVVTITGEAEDFTVDFSAGEVADLMAKFASTITFFGGGPFQLKSLKEKDFYQKLEDQLWDYLEKATAEKSKG